MNVCCKKKQIYFYWNKYHFHSFIAVWHKGQFCFNVMSCSYARWWQVLHVHTEFKSINGRPVTMQMGNFVWQDGQVFTLKWNMLAIYIFYFKFYWGLSGSFFCLYTCLSRNNLPVRNHGLTRSTFRTVASWIFRCLLDKNIHCKLLILLFGLLI